MADIEFSASGLSFFPFFFFLVHSFKKQDSEFCKEQFLYLNAKKKMAVKGTGVRTTDLLSW